MSWNSVPGLVSTASSELSVILYGWLSSGAFILTFSVPRLTNVTCVTNRIMCIFDCDCGSTIPAAMLKPSRRLKGKPLWLSLEFKNGETSVPSGTRKKLLVLKVRSIKSSPHHSFNMQSCNDGTQPTIFAYPVIQCLETIVTIKCLLGTAMTSFSSASNLKHVINTSMNI